MHAGGDERHYGTNQKIVIETKRLVIFPLTQLELMDYKWFMKPVEREYIDRMMDGSFFNTVWLVMEGMVFIGEIIFYGSPGDQGEVEIGCHTKEQYRHKGYMTEAVEGLMKWVKGVGVCSVVAKIEPENIASVKMVEKNGFKKFENSYILKF